MSFVKRSPWPCSSRCVISWTTMYSKQRGCFLASSTLNHVGRACDLRRFGMVEGEQNSMDEHGCPAMPSMAVGFPGPFQRHAVTVNGWQVPLVDAHMQGEDRVLLVLDERLGTEFSVEEAERVVPFLADAIAVALGYGCHPRRDDDDALSAVLPHARPRRLTALTAATTEGGEPT